MGSPDIAKDLPLVVITGPTASGKTSAAIELAEEVGGEIISADSRSLYKYMDIGTAKPTPQERARVPHWGLDLVEPGEYFSAADFKEYANTKIAEIRERGHIPFLVGGTGLYIDAVVFDYQFGPPPDENKRAELEGLTVQQLQEYCVKNNIELPENNQNKRYLIRAIEQKSINNKRRSQPLPYTIYVGITTDRQILKERIARRIEQLFDDGVVNEAILLGKKYGWDSEAMTGNIYPIIRRYLAKELTLEQAKEQSITVDWRLAKRQLTWLKRNAHIHWLPLTEVKSYVFGLLAKQ